jgi:hypothetical protein
MTRRRYLAFDLETVKPFPQGEDWRNHRPLGIGCAAAYALDFPEPLIWHGADSDGGIAEKMGRNELGLMVQDLAGRVDQGYTLLTWNGLGFDFDVLAEESGMQAECRQLAVRHVDMMFHVFCELGYPIGLAAAARRMGTAGKTEGMDGALATRLWREGNRQAVLEYCAQDVRATLELAEACEERRRLSWTSRSGILHTLNLPRGWMAVHRAAARPRPDTSWMTNPIPRSNFTGWLEAGPTA